MSYAAIHPDWEKPRRNMADGYSLEMTAKETEGLREAAPLIRPNTQIAVTFLPGEELEHDREHALPDVGRRYRFLLSDKDGQPAFCLGNFLIQRLAVPGFRLRGADADALAPAIHVAEQGLALSKALLSTLEIP